MERIRTNENTGRPKGAKNKRSATMGAAKRAGGRPKGSRNRASLISREKMAKRLGLLPHEFLALVATGETIKTRRWKDGGWVEETWDPTPDQQIDAAKAAAPYYQPRLVSTKVDHGPIMMKLDQQMLAALPEPMLNALELLVQALATNNALPAIEGPKTIDAEDAEYEELFG